MNNIVPLNYNEKIIVDAANNINARDFSSVNTIFELLKDQSVHVSQQSPA